MEDKRMPLDRIPSPQRETRKDGDFTLSPGYRLPTPPPKPDK